MSALVRFPTQVAKLIPRLGSDHDGEVVVTARLLIAGSKRPGSISMISRIFKRGPGIYSGRDRDFFSWASPRTGAVSMLVGGSTQRNTRLSPTWPTQSGSRRRSNASGWKQSFANWSAHHERRRAPPPEERSEVGRRLDGEVPGP